MILACIIFTVYPNGQTLRPAYTGEGFIGALIHHLYYADTPTNSLPSLHVIYSVGVHISLIKARVKISEPVKGLSFIMMALIIMSTVFVKQHSVLDAVAGLFVSAVIYLLVYMPQETRVFGRLIRQSIW
jgi:membrane-associated phospholipid phosphatase